MPLIDRCFNDGLITFAAQREPLDVASDEETTRISFAHIVPGSKAIEVESCAGRRRQRGAHLQSPSVLQL